MPEAHAQVRGPCSRVDREMPPPTSSSLPDAGVGHDDITSPAEPPTRQPALMTFRCVAVPDIAWRLPSEKAKGVVLAERLHHARGHDEHQHQHEQHPGGRLDAPVRPHVARRARSELGEAACGVQRARASRGGVPRCAHATAGARAHLPSSGRSPCATAVFQAARCAWPAARAFEVVAGGAAAGWPSCSTISPNPCWYLTGLASTKGGRRNLLRSSVRPPGLMTTRPPVWKPLDILTCSSLSPASTAIDVIRVRASTAALG
eukprot:5516582-Prymnesium_polylepis.1